VRRGGPALRHTLAVACIAATGAAHAQVSGSVGVVSDYRYRGYSLSAGDPAVQASIAWDGASGAYAGLFGSSVHPYGYGGGALWMPYAGYARRDSQGRSWDIGVRYSHFANDDYFDYPELHVGVAIRHVALRVHYAHDYFGGTPGAYVEVDGDVPLAERLRLLLHAGAAHALGDGGEGTRVDARIGLSWTSRACDLSIAWHVVGGGDDGYPYYAPWSAHDRQGWVFGCVHRW
jgi:uncharacterized protein (TIGR02001 family)